tara:strand:- start:436 stop:1032 length:597 start_codon:yes stop_codon:yes gene_type:complete
MGLGLPSGGTGDFVLYIKYNAKAGRWYSKYDGEGDKEVSDMTAVFDMENIKTGQLKFAAGLAPEHRWDSSLGANDAVADEGYKRGFLIQIFSDKNIGGLREFSSNAGSVNEAMNALYDTYEAGLAANPGMLPVVKCTQVTPIEGKHGTNFTPTLEIVGWTARPDAMDGGSDAPAPAPQASVPPPAPAPSNAPKAGDAF